MEYLNRRRLEEITARSFQQQQPYPWMSIPDSLTPDGFRALHDTLPDVSGFRRMVGVKRGHGQKSHDRYILHYHPSLDLAPPWREFLSELKGEFYLNFLERLLGREERADIIPTFEWYYAWQGCSVSPHCDAKRKIATQIFYFNTEAEWPSAWGGRILILDDEKRLDAHSAPDFDKLRVAAALEAHGNNSLLFQRTDHSWHGVRPLECPQEAMRKLFIVTANAPTFQVWWRRVRGKDPDGYRLRA
ncbi:MAG: 2OG-Fe(II) oxygenase [Rhodospirillales bacterium]|nr:2OG-Fe(II) oxygenase [Rhodospirillales bacterium]